MKKVIKKQTSNKFKSGEFEKVLAVEGLKLNKLSKVVFAEFDKKVLSKKARIQSIIGRYKIKA